jgi:hypothetical protein
LYADGGKHFVCDHQGRFLGAVFYRVRAFTSKPEWLNNYLVRSRA